MQFVNKLNFLFRNYLLGNLHSLVTDNSLDTPTGMWLPRVDFRTSRGVTEDLWAGTTISPARGGTNILEYGRLSELSRDLEYIKNVFPLYIGAHCRQRPHGGILYSQRKNLLFLE
jgi:Glycosyl hydrolase family 47